MKKLIFLLIFPLFVWGQGAQLPKYKVSTLPTASLYPTYTVQVTDGLTAVDCTSGGGTFNVLCTSHGGAWNSVAQASGTTTNALTMNNSGSGAASGTTFNGSAAQTISYNTIGAQQALTLTTTGSSGPATLSGGALNIPQYSGSSSFVEGPFSYTFSVSAGTITAVNNTTGATVTTGTDLAVVWNTVASGLGSIGGTFYFKPGTYPCNSVTAETVSPYTSTYYCMAIPSSNSGSIMPDWKIQGETVMSGSQDSPAGSGVIFNVTSTAVTAAGGNKLAAWWGRPNTAHSTIYTAGSLYWNSHVTFERIIVQFPANTTANLEAIDMLEETYLEMKSVTAGFATAPTALGSSGDVAFVTPATSSDGVLITDTYAQPGWSIGYAVNTEHSVLINTNAYKSTTGYSYGYERSRNNSPIYHSSNWTHVQCYDDVNCFTSTDANVAAGARLDLDIDLEYILSGTWTYSAGITTGSNLGGRLFWSQVQTNVGRGSLTTPFPSGSGDLYMLINPDGTYGIANIQVTVGTTTINANTCSAYTTATMQGMKTTSVIFAPTPSADYSAVTGWSAAGANLYFNYYPASDTLHWQVCNNSTSNITPGSSTTWNVGAK